MRDAQKAAETIALQALGWIAAQDELLGVFMGATGASREDLRQGAQDPVFLGSVLDFLLMDDSWIVTFCAEQSLPNEAVMQARQALPGGENTHWT